MSSVLIAFSLGIVLVQFLPVQSDVLTLSCGVMGLGLLLCAVWIGKTQRVTHLHPTPWVLHACVGLSLFFLGASWSSWAAADRLTDSLNTRWDEVPVHVKGWIDDLPQHQQSGVRLTLTLDSLTRTEGLPSRVSVVAPRALVGSGHTLTAGSCHHFILQLRPVQGRLNFSGFDSAAWMWASGIRATGKVIAVSDCPTSSIPLMMQLQGIRDGIRSRLTAALPDTPSSCCRGILIALAVGDQSGVDQDQWSVLWRTGVGHLVSISGVHVTLLAGILRQLAERGWRLSAWACRLLPASRAGLAIGCIAALAYALVAGFAVPTQRTLFMLSAGWVLSSLGIQTGAARLYWCAVAVTLILNPFACLSPSFWLSYAAVGGLILADLGLFGRVPQWRAELKSQWVVNLALLPLVAVWFGQLSFIAPLANAIAIPWVGMLVTPLTLLAMFPHLSFIAMPADYLMQLLMHILNFLSQPSWAAVPISAPDGPAFWVALLGTICLLMPGCIPHRHWAWLSLLPLCFPAHAIAIPGEAKVEVLDIGQGLSVLIRTQHHSLLFDTGPRWEGGDAGQSIIVPILKSYGIPSLDLLILSHPDSDHVGGANSVAQVISIQHTFAGFERPHAFACLQKQQWDWDQVHFAFLYPRSDTPSSDPGSHRQQSHLRNNHACVLKVTSGAHSVLIPADIEAQAEQELVEESHQGFINLKSDVVIAAHHGSHTSSTEAFIEASHAHYVIFSAGWRNHFHHPHQDVIQRWMASGARPFRTDLDGAIRITLSASTLNVNSAHQARHHYWDR